MRYLEKFSHFTEGRPYSFHHTVLEEGLAELLYSHWHQEMEILWVYQGAMVFFAENQRYFLEAGDYMILPPARIHYGLSDQGRACSFRAFVFSPAWLFDTKTYPFLGKYLLPFLYHGQESTICLQKKSAHYQILVHELNQIFSFSQLSPGECELALMGHLLLLWQKLFSLFFQSREELWNHVRREDRISYSLDYIHQQYGSDLTLEQLADQCGISREHYCRCFKQFTGLSPFNYLNRYRVMQSCLLLRDTDKKISEVATLSGFNNVSYYNRQFSKWMGVTPSSYRSSIFTKASRFSC